MINQEDQSPLLQSEDWQKLQNDLGEITFFEETSKYHFLAIKKTTPLGPYLYLPYGPYLDNSVTSTDIKTCIKQIKNMRFLYVSNPKILQKIPKIQTQKIRMFYHKNRNYLMSHNILSLIKNTSKKQKISTQLKLGVLISRNPLQKFSKISLKVLELATILIRKKV